MKGERKSQVLLKCINPIDMKNIEVLRGQTNHNEIPQSEQRGTALFRGGLLKVNMIF